MEDLSQQINNILSDPNSMQQIQSVISSLGLGDTGQQKQQAPAQQPATGSAGSTPDLSALAGMLGALGNHQAASSQQSQSQNALASLGGLGNNTQMLGMLTKLAPLLSQVNQEDDSTRLLYALRPLLGAERQKKVDEALKILQMMRLLPLLKESGVFSGLLSGLI